MYLEFISVSLLTNILGLNSRRRQWKFQLTQNGVNKSIVLSIIHIIAHYTTMEQDY